MDVSPVARRVVKHDLDIGSQTISASQVTMRSVVTGEVLFSLSEQFGKLLFNIPLFDQITFIVSNALEALRMVLLTACEQ